MSLYKGKEMRVSLISSLVLLSSCGIQSLPESKNAVDASLAEITNQYKRRADLIPNFVSTVKGYASHEKEVLVGVTNARAAATQAKIDIGSLSPEKIKEYQQAQGQLSQALGRLMVVSERYPQLKADQNFRDLQVQLEGSENRIAVARGRYIKAIERLNNLVSVPPSSLVNSIFYKYEKMPQWDVDASEKEKIQEAPKVEFN